MKKPIKVAAIVHKKICTFEYGIATEVFSLDRPEVSEKPLYHFSTYSFGGDFLEAQGGCVFQATGSLAELQSAEVIVVPGWTYIESRIPEEVLTIIKEANERGVQFLSICSGVYVLASSGILNGKRATTHWRYIDKLRQRFPDVIFDDETLFVESENIITSAGSTAGLDASLYLVRQQYGSKIANDIARRLVINEHRQGFQPQVSESIDIGDEAERIISEVKSSIRNNLAGEYNISEMAKLARMSERTFQRRFYDLAGIPPIQWLNYERVIAATELLLVSKQTVEHIAFSVGFKGADILRYHFQKQFGISPIEYREKYTKPRYR
ncbi:MAG: helix-turn-helix domain-containing protein [Pseudobacteriovorax sp.]|nr:helix-turn-helix domain-containing protein [Pseudobacteriovorax sp.]